jgi:AraC-like DNA-binding protein
MQNTIQIIGRKVKNMRKYEIQYNTADAIRPINSQHEEAVFISADAEYPVRDILVGRTHPFAEYRKNLGATKKYYIFEYVLSGKGMIRFDGEWYKLEAGDTYIIDKNTVRKYQSDPDCPLDKIWVSFSSDYIDSMLLHCGVKAGVYRVRARALFEGILAVAMGKSSVKEKVFTIANSIHEIIMEIAKAKKAGNDNISEIKNSILAMLYEKCSLDEIASRFFMSKSNLIRTFKKHTGTTPYKFLIEEKIRIAKLLLGSTNMSVKTIAEQLCFTDEHYFSYIFKEKTGISPLQFRRGDGD